MAIFSSQGQALCGFDAIHHNLLAQNPAYNQMIQQNTARWIQAQGNSSSLIVNTPTGTVYEIPVVVHVMNTGGAIGSIYNPSDAQLIGMINYLNQSYAATWSGYPDSVSGGAYIPIRFKLALRAPGCTSTNGIDRYTVPGTQYSSLGVNSTPDNNATGLDDTTLKNYDRWNPNDYYNIWVVNKIDGNDGTSGSFIAGFAYFAGASAKYDGTIMLATQAVAGQITLPHEIGHAMGLFHTFEGGASSCPPNSNCSSDGDQVCDTEPMQQGSPGTCPSGINPCTGTAWQNTQKNFMNYSNCQDRFTPGQRTKMLFNLQLYRGSLLSSQAGQPIATTTAASCAPTSSNPNNTFNIGPRKVSMTGDNMTMVGASDGYNGDGNLVLLDKTCVQKNMLTVGNTYQLDVTTSSNSETVKAYIDYNNNGVFDASELAYTVTANGTHSGQITIPNTGVVTCTNLRMRVISDVASNTNIQPCGALTYGQAEDYTVYIKPAGTTSNVTIALTTGTNPSCPGTQLVFTATPGANAVSPTYKWFVNNVFTGITTSTYTTTTIANNSSVRVQMFYNTSGGCAGDSAFSNTIYVQRVANLAPSVSITAATLPACAGQPVTFTATPVNGGTTPGYQWSVNGTAIAGATNATFTSSTLGNGNTVNVVMTSSAACANPLTATSNTITVVLNANLTPSVSITATGNPGCPGQPITFTPTPTNGGTAPTYQWNVNGTPVSGATNSTFTSTTLANADVVTVSMVSNNPCATTAPVTSNGITVSFAALTANVSVSLTGGTNPTCAGKPMTFSASATNPGTAPAYDWKINGSSTGITTPTYTSALLNNGDVITCTMTSSNPCVTNPVVTSNAITVVINPVDTTSVNVAITQGTNPGCSDSLLEFTASAVNMGTTPDYLWYVNGTAVATGNVFSSTTLANGDVVTVRVSANTIACRTADTLFSTGISVIRLTTPSAPVISLIGTMLVANTSATVQWYGPNGLIVGATNPSYAPTTQGAYYCVVTNSGCNSGPSNVLQISLLEIGSYKMDDMKVYPNPTNGQITLDWGAKTVNMKIDVYSSLGQGLMHEEINNGSMKRLDLSTFANGIYFVVLHDEAGNSGTLRITLTK